MILKAARTMFTLSAVASMVLGFWELAATMSICAIVMALLEED